jgi:hypothetical protein
MFYSGKYAVKQDILDLTTGRDGREAADLSQHGRPDAKALEYFLATGLGSRGGPNKESNKFKRSPGSYSFF